MASRFNINHSRVVRGVTLGKLPAYLHYAKDWLTDVNLCRCSKAAKGVWQDILDVMFLNSVRGVACTEDGIPWTDDDIARAIGGDIAENLTRINELLTKGVARRNANGAIYSRRMVLDEKERSDTKERVRKFRSSDRVTANETVMLRPCTGDGNATAIKKISESYISEIYKAYPRKIGRGDAYKAIAAALQRILRGEDSPGGLFHSLDDAVVYLVQRVKLFSSTPAGQADQYTPHPATWFNKKRYLDDESEWSRDGTHQQGAKQSRAREIASNNLAAFAAAMGGASMDFGAVTPQRADNARDQTVAGEVKRLQGKPS